MADRNMQNKISLEEVRRRLAERGGEDPWRSLSELAETEEFRSFLEDEFPRQTRQGKSLNRRDFMKLMAGPLALAGLTACMPQPLEKIMPYAEAPEGWVPGKPLFFATAMPLGGYARGLVVESHEGRPTKVEGNPKHPASLGATDVFAQGSVLTLYDPDRAKTITNQGQNSSWAGFVEMLGSTLQESTRLRFLSTTVTSPTLIAEFEAVLERFPQARWHQWDPINRDNVRQGAMLALGEAVETRYSFERANVILSLDSDFLTHEPGSIRYAKEFAARRRVDPANPEMNRLYVVENSLTSTGAIADHRLPLQAGQVLNLAQALAARLGVEGLPEVDPGVPAEWLDAVVEDLQANAGASLVIAGMQQPPAVHALAHAMNAVLGNVGQTVFYTDPVEALSDELRGTLTELVEALNAGEVDMLVILEGNPAFTAPTDLQFANALTQAPLSIYWGLYSDETAELCTWHIPATHYLEMWSDARAFDGTISIIQPLIEPLYESHSHHELLAVFADLPQLTGFEIVRSYWQDTLGEGSFEATWRQALADGIVPDTALEPRQVAVTGNLAAALEGARPAGADPNSLEIVFLPDPTIWDGEFANNSWLQETPKPVTLLVWDNAALMSPNTAERLGVTQGDVVELRSQGLSVNAPVFVQPGQADNSVTVYLGYGRRRGGQVQEGAGFDAYALRTSGALWQAYGLEVQPTGEQYKLITPQDHHTLEGRNLARHGTLEEFRQHPEFVHEGLHFEGPPPSLYPEYEYDTYAWGMSINLNTCIGCNACVLACMAENNIPVVGKEQVEVGREMHWLLVDVYYEGQDLSNPDVLFQPRTCMHCEKAPCEPVCPVAATVHSSEGINEMVYNRCVGTRYCSNNCPYKVRRFNFLDFTNTDTLPLKMVNNPDVAVRNRGVMEKCTYCVQRVNAARVQARVEGRTIQEGEVKTACQQVCPTDAIIFGDINNPESQVRQLKEQPLSYGMLEELGTQPRTTYLARLSNPNPRLAEGEA